MQAPDHALKTLRRIAPLCLMLLLAVTVLSAFLRHQAAGLGCTDWPACAITQGVHSDGGSAVAAARLAHRITASSALLLVIAMVWLSVRARPALRPERWLSLGLLALALGLALLGVYTTGARAPAVAIGNLTGGFAMLALAARLAAPLPAAGGLGAAAAGVAALLLLHAVGGVLLSATHAGRACADLGECRDLVRSAGWAWQALAPWGEPIFAGATPQAEGAPAQLLHRLGSFVIAPLLAWCGWAAIRHGRRRAGIAVWVLLATQLALGLVIGSTGLPLVLVLLHNVGAAVMLALLVRLV